MCLLFIYIMAFNMTALLLLSLLIAIGTFSIISINPPLGVFGLAAILFVLASIKMGKLEYVIKIFTTIIILAFLLIASAEIKHQLKHQNN